MDGSRKRPASFVQSPRKGNRDLTPPPVSLRPSHGPFGERRSQEIAMHPRSLRRLACLVSALTVTSVESAPGATQMAAAPIGSGRVIVAPYAWLAGISGEADVRDLSTDVDVPFRDLLQHLR